MKRRGFTLIELMVVIAIIIILAAIAIPNYLSMTARAKRSRVASDFASVATALETYKTDWNNYPAYKGGIIDTTATPATIKGGAGSAGAELAGTSYDPAGATVNNTSKQTAAGETGGIQYMTKNIIVSMVNPYSNAVADQYVYEGAVATDTKGSHWMLTANVTAGSTVKALWRSDETTNLADTTPVFPTD